METVSLLDHRVAQGLSTLPICRTVSYVPIDLVSFLSRQACQNSLESNICRPASLSDTSAIASFSLSWLAWASVLSAWIKAGSSLNSRHVRRLGQKLQSSTQILIGVCVLTWYHCYRHRPGAWTTGTKPAIRSQIHLHDSLLETVVPLLGRS